MTIASRSRAHPLWPAYVAARAAGDRKAASLASDDIADDLGLSEEQRLKNLPKIAKQTKPKGRPRKAPYEAACPHCGHELVIEVTR